MNDVPYDDVQQSKCVRIPFGQHQLIKLLRTGCQLSDPLAPALLTSFLAADPSMLSLRSSSLSGEPGTSALEKAGLGLRMCDLEIKTVGNQNVGRGALAEIKETWKLLLDETPQTPAARRPENTLCLLGMGNAVGSM